MHYEAENDIDPSVAPYAGAWIEIHKVGLKLVTAMVAPYAGEWIEIDKRHDTYNVNHVRSLRRSVDKKFFS